MLFYVLMGLGLLFFVIYRFLPEDQFFRLGATAGATTKFVRLVMAVVVSIVVLASALYVILSGTYDISSEKWAFGTVGMIIGFWLRHEK
jgi:hypothetical protein